MDDATRGRERDRLVAAHAGLARHYARMFSPAWDSHLRADLEQDGYVALIEAAGRYVADPAVATRYAPGKYLSLTVRSRVIDAVRLGSARPAPARRAAVPEPAARPADPGRLERVERVRAALEAIPGRHARMLRSVYGIDGRPRRARPSDAAHAAYRAAALPAALAAFAAAAGGAS